jgi:hypothetical protein
MSNPLSTGHAKKAVGGCRRGGDQRSVSQVVSRRGQLFTRLQHGCRLIETHSVFDFCHVSV